MTRTPLLLTALGAALIAGCRSGTVESDAPVAPAAVPATAEMLPVGTTLEVRLNQTLGTRTSQVGDEFTATVTEPLYAANGEIAVPAGATVFGRVTGLDDSDGIGDQAAIRLDFHTLRANGRSYPFEASIVETELETTGGTSRDQVLRNAGIGAAAGAVLGAVVGDTELDDILLGGAIGAAAGTVISLGRGDVEPRLPAGTEMRIRSSESVALR